MIIKLLSIREGMYEKTFRFSERVTLICSNNVNGVGKTTLLRALLYALGENVSGTQGCRLSKFETKLVLTSDAGKKIKLLRTDKANIIVVIDGQEEKRFTLPFDLADLHAVIYGNSDKNLTSNLLGCMYIDQDKGWTLLNRGKVIGDIGFNIEDFIRGLRGINCERLQASLQGVERDLKKYKFIKKAAGYQSDLVEQPGAEELGHNHGRDSERLLALRVENASYKKRIARLRRSLKDNKRFVEMINGMGLRIKTDAGDVVRVKAENLVDYDDTEKYIEAEILALRTQQEKVLQQIADLETALGADEQLFEVESLALSFDRQIAGMNLDVSNIDEIIESLGKQRTSLNKQLREELQSGRDGYDTISNFVLEYCTMLGVRETYEKDGKGILTSDLQTKSGSFYHLLVFAFRMAYASAVYQLMEINLPLIIDSMRGRELSDENFEKSVELLNDSMSDHQQIIATISEGDIVADEVICINETMMEKAVLVDDIEAWELRDEEDVSGTLG